MKIILFTAALTLNFRLQTLNCSAQPGTLDITFSFDGKATTNFGSYDDRGRSVAIQSDGKIVVAGYSVNGADYDFALVRYNADGTLDNTFGADGMVTTPIGSSDEGANSVVFQGDGKIVVAGCSINGSDYDFALVRYNSDGILDNTFGLLGNGIVVTDIGSADDEGYSVAIQTDGKIVVAGFNYNGTDYDFTVARYNGDVTGISDIAEQSTEIKIFPNPFSASATISPSPTLPKGKGVFILYDIVGREVKSISLPLGEGQRVGLERGNLPAGMYFYKVTDRGKILATGKLAIQ